MTNLTLAVETIDLSKNYEISKPPALDYLSIQVRRGEIFGFLGPNGAGKTTTIRLLLDLIRPTDGRAFVFGLDCHKSSVQVRKRIGYLPGELNLYPNYNGARLLKLFMRLRSGCVTPSYVNSICQRLNVDLETHVIRLSHGNRQKIGLLLALMAKPDLLILDEPTIGLDPLAQNQVLELLREFRSEGGTIFFSSHDLSEVEQICDRVGIIKNGRLVDVDEVNEIKNRRVQRIRISFAEIVPTDVFDALPGVRVLESTPRTIFLSVSGEPDGIVKAASHYHVTSLESKQFSLEEIFMDYYKPDSRDTDNQNKSDV